MIICAIGLAKPKGLNDPENYAYNFIGFSKTLFYKINLPFDLSKIGFGKGCNLYTGPELVKIIKTKNPDKNFTRAFAEWQIPNDPALRNARFYTQWICNDSRVSSPLKYTVTNALECNIANPRRYVGNTLWNYGAKGNSSDLGRRTVDEYNAITRFGGIFK